MIPIASQNDTQQKLMTGAEIFVRSLIAEGVELLFGYPGAATIGVYDVLYGLAGSGRFAMEEEQPIKNAMQESVEITDNEVETNKNSKRNNTMTSTKVHEKQPPKEMSGAEIFCTQSCGRKCPSAIRISGRFDHWYLRCAA